MTPPINLGILASSSFTGEYWISTTGAVADEQSPADIAVDSQGNVYSVGYTRSSGSTSEDLFLIKYNNLGEIQWQKYLGGSTFVRGEGIAIDSGDNVYVTGMVNDSSVKTLTAKYNSSGTLQWAKSLGGSEFDAAYGIATDASDNIYIAGNTNSASFEEYDAITAKYSNSGNLQWQIITLSGGDRFYFTDVAADSGNNVYVVGRERLSAGIDKAYLAKYNSSGVFQWGRTSATGYNSLSSIIIDSFNNIFISGRLTSSGTMYIAKISSSGTPQWQKTLGVSGSSFNDLAIDSQNNVYAIGSTSSAGAGSNDIVIAKYSNAGTLQWQRTLGGSTSEGALGIAIDPSDNIFVLGSADFGTGDRDVFIAKLPSDGSLTGTYIFNGQTLSYSPSSLISDDEIIMDNSNFDPSRQSNLFSSSTVSLTSSDINLTEIQQFIG